MPRRHRRERCCCRNAARISWRPPLLRAVATDWPSAWREVQHGMRPPPNGNACPRWAALRPDVTPAGIGIRSVSGRWRLRGPAVSTCPDLREQCPVDDIRPLRGEANETAGLKGFEACATRSPASCRAALRWRRVAPAVRPGPPRPPPARGGPGTGRRAARRVAQLQVHHLVDHHSPMPRQQFHHGAAERGVLREPSRTGLGGDHQDPHIRQRHTRGEIGQTENRRWRQEQLARTGSPRSSRPGLVRACRPTLPASRRCRKSGSSR